MKHKKVKREPTKDSFTLAEADLGMFSMFGRTGAPTKAQKNSVFATL